MDLIIHFVWQIHWRWFLMMNESTLEKALKPVWKAKERFYEENRDLTIKQIIEKIEGNHFISAAHYQNPCIPVVFHNAD
jgi:hypothetical protein